MIYCVEDDSGIRDLTVYTLKSSGFEAVGFADPAGFWLAMESDLPKLVILDIMLPGEDGISILKKLRANTITKNIPVIMATAKGSEFDKVVGLDSGADDYLVKPFGMMEMVSRVKALLRRAYPKAQTTGTVCGGGIELDVERHTVRAIGELVQLTLKEYELLRILMENPGVVFTRDRLLSKVWGNDFVGETRTVDVHVGTLRTKLGECGERIETVRGVGYKFEVSNK